jgi:putative ABC transport system permease protein
VSSFIHDLRDAARGLAKTPGFTASAILTLTLGIGANTALFSLVDSLLLKRLPVKNPERLVMITGGPASLVPQWWTYPLFDQFVQRQLQLPHVSGIFAVSPSRINLAASGEADPVDGLWVSGKFFDTLGVSPFIGRTLSETDDQANGGLPGPSAVISYQFWLRRFGGSADAIGRTIYVERVPFTIVGVTPRNFFGVVVGSTFDILLPIRAQSLIRDQEPFQTASRLAAFTVIGSIAPGTSLEAGTSELRSIQPQIRAATKPAKSMDPYLEQPFGLVRIARGPEFPYPMGLHDRYRSPLLILLAVAGVVLVIGCANLANLLLARGAAHSHELNVRLALGASGWQLARRSFAETLLLSGIGAALGLLIAREAGVLLVGQLGSTALGKAFLELSVNWRILGFTVGMMVVTALLCGLVPALGASRLQPIDALKARGRGPDRTRSRVAGTLVIAQVSLSLMLVMVAGLFVGTFVRLVKADLGFEQSDMLVVEVDAQHSGIDRRTEALSLFEKVGESVRSVPGVIQSAISNAAPFQRGGYRLRFQVPETSQETIGQGYWISPGWFSTYRMALLAGRDFDDADRLDRPRVVIVNQSFATRILGGTNPVGRTIQQREGNRYLKYQIVGLISDSASESIQERASAPPSAFYFPLAQYDTTVFPPPGSVKVSIRAVPGPSGWLSRSVVAAIGKVNPDLSLTIRSLSDQVSLSISQERLLAMLAAFFGMLALLLAMVGLYGVTSYAVSQRQTEMAIRMALGGTPRNLVWMVLQHVGVLIAGGIAAGIILSWWATRFIATSLLYGLRPHDPVTVVGAVVVLVIVGACAAFLPARRATRVDPAQVLKEA